MKSLWLSIAVLLTTTVSAQDLSPAEQKIVQTVQQNQKQEFTLLEKLVNINSGTQNIAGVTKVGEILRPEFEKLGFKTQWVPLPKDLKRAATLVATHPGKGPRLLLIAHLDTVFAPGHPFQKYQNKGATISGPGVLDDKGGDVIILYALKAMQVADVLKDAAITVVMTGDEEDSGKPTSISRKPLTDLAKNADIALDFEGSDTLDTLSTARRGVEVWELQTTGLQEHASKMFQEKVGFGAAFEMARILNSIRDSMSTENYFAFNPGILVAGDLISEDAEQSKMSVTGKQNIIAKSALAKGDFRYISTEQRERAMTQIDNIVTQHLPHTTAKVIYKGGIPAMPPTQANRNLLEQYNQMSQAMGAGKVTELDPNERGAGDISYVAGLVKANLVGLGPVGTGGHTPDEVIDAKAFITQTERASVFLHRLTQH